MKLFISLFTLLASMHVNAVLPQEEAAPSIKLDWFWHNEYGQEQLVNAQFTREQLKQGLQQQHRINFTLTSPVRALHGYIGPRLMHVLDSINAVSPSDATKFVSIEHAFSVRDASPESTLFWQAYYQYQDDAFNFLAVNPCYSQELEQGPCIRPNYSQVFYHSRGTFNALAQQLKSRESEATSIQNVQNWVLSIPDSNERLDSFSPPMAVLLENAADSDERAILLATLISQIAPKYHMFLVYPATSQGSVSPAWLTIEARSGATGTPVIIDNHQHTLLSGSSAQLKEMMQSNTPMISEPLY
ncbi:hypothetical protein [Motilimonas eburnea]|uniref:hypothetical protein n=1 Tax=Motilimonas eburnea TaxID=1737488 RepID=UPI001E2CCE4D|nr:hypothetical protein [Motilimonas eburnea]MCE2570999.1 hypothetical protein [Motilimonas eburnea]